MATAALGVLGAFAFVPKDGHAATESTVSASYGGPPVPIPANLSVVFDSVTAVVPVTASGSIDDVDLRFDGSSCNTDPGSTTVGLSRWQLWDLSVTLTSPAGTTVDLMGPVPHDPLIGANLCQTTFDDEAAAGWSSSMSVGAPFTGSFRPHAALGILDGEAAAGDWVLTVSDRNNDAPRDSWLRAFSIVVTAGGTASTTSYTGPPLLIPPQILPWVSASIPLSAGFTSLSDVALRIDGATCTEQHDSSAVGISHTVSKHLYIRLTSPAGTIVDLTDPWGGTASTANNLCLVTFTDDGPLPFTAADEGPFAGFWRPADPLSAFDLEDPNGIWTLSVANAQTGLDTGAVRAFTVIVTGPALGDPGPTTAASSTAAPTTTIPPTSVAATTAPTTPPTTTSSSTSVTSSTSTPSTITSPDTTASAGGPTASSAGGAGAIPATGGLPHSVLLVAVAAVVTGVAMLASRSLHGG